MKTGQHILSVSNLTVKRGGVQVLDIPSFGIDEGHVVSLIGPNGTGKSTLLLTLAGLLKPSAGEVAFRGRDVLSGNDLFSYRRHLAVVFQDPLLFDTTVFENVASGLRIRRFEAHEVRQRVDECLELFGVAHLARRSARKISGGEAQRTSLARAFAVNPEIIFLDEPFASLDPPTREAIIEDLQRILRGRRTTAVIATHDQAEALRLSDQMAVMNGGRIVQSGPPVEIINRPADEFVASFVGVETVLAGQVTEKRNGCITVSLNGRQIEAAADYDVGSRVICCIRPENVTISTGGREGETSARNEFPAQVVKISPMGLYQKIVLDCGFPLVSYITVSSLDQLALAEGRQVVVSFKATAVHVIKKS